MYACLFKHQRLPTQRLRVRPPSLQLKLLKGDTCMYWFLPGKMLPCIRCFTLGTLKTWFVMCGGRSSILHYGPLIETNNLIAPNPWNPNWQSVRERRSTKAMPPLPPLPTSQKKTTLSKKWSPQMCVVFYAMMHITKQLKSLTTFNLSTVLVTDR